MVILIGAAGCTGKTLMAQTLLERYKIPYLSADHLKMGLFRANRNCGFFPEDSDERIEKKLWSVLRGIAHTCIENGQHLIMEGCYLFPGRLKALARAHREQVIAVFMGFSEEYIRAHYDSGILAHRSAIEKRGWPEERTIEGMIEAHQAMKRRCAEASVPYFEIAQDYGAEIEKVYRWIDGEVARIQKGIPD